MENDKDWIEWNRRNDEFYLKTGRENGIHKAVLNSGYKILERANIRGDVLEIGPGFISHLEFWDYSKIQNYTLFDSRDKNLKVSRNILNDHKIHNDKVLYNKDIKLKCFRDNQFDHIISFFTLEHIPDIENFILEIKRILKPRGSFIGSIPTEGGFLWGTGRYFTTYQWFKKHTYIDFYKIICWEHVNFADEIVKLLNHHFATLKSSFWPFKVSLIDLNITYSFILHNND